MQRKACKLQAASVSRQIIYLFSKVAEKKYEPTNTEPPQHLLANNWRAERISSTNHATASCACTRVPLAPCGRRQVFLWVSSLHFGIDYASASAPSTAPALSTKCGCNVKRYVEPSSSCKLRTRELAMQLILSN